MRRIANYNSNNINNNILIIFISLHYSIGISGVRIAAAYA
ncbi:hypothetical protein ASZ90_013630 [hydrocarbon metagenome]|uniref:Uncharacterized protein n=1 Tax=hydrocarbon metagenome TaxID=938273 RepID=A0A0W8F748_9ZZZZ